MSPIKITIDQLESADAKRTAAYKELTKDTKTHQYYHTNPDKFFKMVGDKLDITKDSPLDMVLLFLGYFATQFYITSNEDIFMSLLLDFVENLGKRNKEIHQWLDEDVRIK